MSDKSATYLRLVQRAACHCCQTVLHAAEIDSLKTLNYSVVDMKLPLCCVEWFTNNDDHEAVAGL